MQRRGCSLVDGRYCSGCGPPRAAHAKRGQTPRGRQVRGVKKLLCCRWLLLLLLLLPSLSRSSPWR